MQSEGLATQRPFHLDESGELFAAPYLVIEYIEAKPEFAPANLGDCTLQLATHLAISRLDILWLFGVEAMHDFTQYYQAMTTIDFTNLPYWDLRAALRAAPNLAEWATAYPPLGREDITEQTMREGHRLFTAQAF